MKQYIIGVCLFFGYLFFNVNIANAMYFSDYIYQNARVGQLAGVKKYLDQGLNVDAVNLDRKTALCQSVDAWDYQAYRRIRQLGANVKHKCMNSVDSKVAQAFDKRYVSMYKTTSSVVSGENNTTMYVAVGALAAVGAGVALAGSGGSGSDDYQQEIPEKCIAGEKWNGSECVSVCAEGEKWNGSECVSVCAAGETWNGSECVSVCAEGEKWNGSECVSVCAAGEKWNGSECVSVCAAGETWNGSECVSVCAAGETWNGSECVSVCATGEKWNGSECVSVCAEGETWNGSECVSVCAEGEKWNGSECVSVCAEGEKWDGDRCIPIVCSDGMILIGNSCVAEENISKEVESEDTVFGIFSERDIFNLYSTPETPNDERLISIAQKGNGDVFGIYGMANITNAYVVGETDDGSVQNSQDIGQGSITIISEGSGSVYGLYSEIEDKTAYKETINAEAWNGGKAYGNIDIKHNGSGTSYGILSDVRAYNAFSRNNGKAYGNITIHGNGDIYGVKGYVIAANAVSPGGGLETIGNINLYQYGNADVYGIIVGFGNIPGAGAGGQDIGAWAGFNSQAYFGGQSEGNLNIYNYGNKNVYGMNGRDFLTNALLQKYGVKTVGNISIDNQGGGDVYGMSGGERMYNARVENSNGKSEGTINIANSGDGNVFGMYTDVSNGLLYNAKVFRSLAQQSAEEDADDEGDVASKSIFEADSDGTAIGTINITNAGNGKAYGMYGAYYLYNASVDSNIQETDADGLATGIATINILNKSSGEAYGMYLSGVGGNIYNLSSEHEKSVVNIVNAGDGTAVGLYAGRLGIVKNSGEININNLGDGLAIGIYGDAGARILNSGTINIYRQTYIDDKTGEVYEPDSDVGGIAYGIYAKNGAKVENTGTITITGADISKEIYLEDGATFYNSGDVQFYDESGQDEDKVLKSVVDMNSIGGDVILEQGGRFFASAFKGEMGVSEQVVMGSLKNEYAVVGALQAEKVDDLEVVSHSAMFQADKRENSDGGFDVVLHRKDLKNILDDSSLGLFYENNYELGNNIALFDELKLNKSDVDLNKMAANLSGMDVLPSFRKEDALIYRHLSRQFNDNLFNKPEEHYIGGYKYIDISAEKDGMLVGSDSKVNAAYGLLKGTADNGITYGFGATITHLKSDYDSGASRKSNGVGFWLPIGYDFGGGMKWFSKLYAGYADGDYERTTKFGKYSADFDEYQYGLTNEARLKIRLNNGFDFEPLLELNLLGIYQDGADEGKQINALRVDGGNSLSLEGGLGAYLSKEFVLGDNSKLGFQIGGVYYVEFLNADDGRYTSMNGMDGRYRLKNKFQDNYALMSFRANYTYKDLMLYMALARETDGDNNFTVDTGLQYKF